MQIDQNVSLRRHNSFGFDIQAEHYCRVRSIEDTREALQWAHDHKQPVFILGGGSNIVFTQNVSGLVLHIDISHLHTETQIDKAIVTVGAGINWHELVRSTVTNGHYGLENMALIPGNAGSAPIQNIGAYGKEVCDHLKLVEVIHQDTGECHTLDARDCDFAYRHSMFKTPAGNRYIITGIQLELSLQDNPTITYRALQDSMTDAPPKASEVFEHVCRLRQAKLPDPKHIGNAGSFFKNPVISARQADELAASHPDLPMHPESHDQVKIPAAWLIDRAGWKGYRSGDIGVHKKQALVLVNYGGGSGQQIATLADKIQRDVKTKYNVQLEREPVLY